MSHYTFTVLNEQVETIERVIHSCADDLEALEIAQKLSEGRAVEVRNGPRMVFRLKPQQQSPGPPISRPD